MAPWQPTLYASKSYRWSRLCPMSYRVQYFIKVAEKHLASKLPLIDLSLVPDHSDLENAVFSLPFRSLTISHLSHAYSSEPCSSVSLFTATANHRCRLQPQADRPARGCSDCQRILSHQQTRWSDSLQIPRLLRCSCSPCWCSS